MAKAVALWQLWQTFAQFYKTNTSDALFSGYVFALEVHAWLRRWIKWFSLSVSLSPHIYWAHTGELSVIPVLFHISHALSAHPASLPLPACVTHRGWKSSQLLCGLNIPRSWPLWISRITEKQNLWACSALQHVQNVPVHLDSWGCLCWFSTPIFELLLLLGFLCSAEDMLKTEKISLYGPVAQGGGGGDKKHGHMSNQSGTRSDWLFNSWPRAVLKVRKEITALFINLFLCMFCFSQHTHTWYCSYILFIWQGRNKKKKLIPVCICVQKLSKFSELCWGSDFMKLQ